MAKPHLNLLRVQTAAEKRRSAGVAEGVEARPRHAGRSRRWFQHAGHEVARVEHGAPLRGEDELFDILDHEETKLKLASHRR